MMNDEKLERLMLDVESDRVERKESPKDGTAIREAICAFANDMPNYELPGVVFVGVKDNGECSHLPVTDEVLRNLAAARDDGNIQPIPSMVVQKRTIRGCEMAVIIVQPAEAPPVRYRGRIYIRVGPRRGIASPQEEHQLNERRRARDHPFDLRSVRGATIQDVDLDLLAREYLPQAIARETLEANKRSSEDQLRSLRFLALAPESHPTVVGLLVIGKQPSDFISGAYVQFLRIDGTTLADPIADQKEVHGPIGQLLQRVEDILEANIRVATDIRTSPREVRSPDYPVVALQQIVRNAIMHRDYEFTNAPVRIHWFDDRVEVQSPGGPFGQVTRSNFGQSGLTDYRNPHLAEAMHHLGYVQRFGVGIPTAQDALRKNGNPPAGFDPQDTHVLVRLRRRP
jgi:ATP-dependent DNA helicase RecG